MNLHAPHLLILPEDEHDHRLAKGFIAHLKINHMKIKMLAWANGWRKAQAQITEPGSAEIQHLGRYPYAHLLVVLDFDKRPNRLAEIRAKIPATIGDRVYVLGAWDAPQRLKSQFAYKHSFEQIGAALFEDCLAPVTVASAVGNPTWQHPALQHNQAELQRFKTHVCPFLVGT